MVAGNTDHDSASSILQIPSDSVYWIIHSSGTYNLLNGIAFGNGYFIAVGEFGTILQSGPIINLTVTPHASSALLGLSLEAATGLNYTIQTSTNLTSWIDVMTINLQSNKVIVDGLPATSDRLFYRAFSR